MADVTPHTPPVAPIAGPMAVAPGTSLVELLQSLAHQERTVAITLTDEGGACGRIIVGEGTVLHAEAGGVTGRDAFFALCGARTTGYTLSPAATIVSPRPAV